MGAVPDLAVRALPPIEQGYFLFDICMGDASLMREHDGMVRVDHLHSFSFNVHRWFV